MRTLAAVLCLALSWAPRTGVADEPKDWVAKNLSSLVDLYRHFHQNPELSFHEKATAARLAAELRAVGCDVTENFGGYGVVGILTNGEGGCIMVRSDLDALPVTEDTQLPYASKVRVRDDEGRDTGVMHACGHDIHITCLVGVARYLAANKEGWHGTVMFVGQPAEEKGGGARPMLKAGLFEKFRKPDLALALHVDSRRAAGRIGYRAGYMLANVDSVDITIRGRGGHGAFPFTTIDPIVEAAHLVVDLQTIVSREIKPSEAAVVTVGSIHGGTKHNIIPDTCHLQLTVRSFTPEVRKKLLDAIARKAKAVAASAGGPEPILAFSDATPALKNDEKLVARLVPIFQRVVGEANVETAEQSMGGEDFSEYGLAGVPICMFQVGSVDAERLASFEQRGLTPPSLHSPRYYPDAEPTITTGVTTMSSILLELMR